MNPRPYQRLPGRGRRGGFLTLAVATPRCSLWLGADHLLSVNARDYQEEYKRFYYRDIQAIITRKTKRAFVRNVILTILLAFFGSLTFVAGPNGRIVAAILTATTLIFLVIGLLRGPTCVCHLRTAVHIEELPSLNRLRTTQKAMARLRPLIEQAQGTLTREELLAAAAARALETPAGTQPVPGAFGRREALPPRHEPGVVHLGLYWLLLVRAGWTSLKFSFNGVGIALVGLLLFLGIVLLTVWAIIRQTDSDLPPTLRRLTVSTVGYLCLMTVLSYIPFVVSAMNNPYASQWEIMRAAAVTSVQDSMWWSAASMVSMVCSLGWGLSGLILLARFRRRSKLLGAPPETHQRPTQG